MDDSRRYTPKTEKSNKLYNLNIVLKSGSVLYLDNVKESEKNRYIDFIDSNGKLSKYGTSGAKCCSHRAGT